MDRPAFENVKNQIGACGIWCGSCAVGNGSLRLASERYLEVLEGHGIEHWAPPKLNYAALSEGLKIVADIATCAGCRRGGGRADCEMKTCSAQRGLGVCSACNDSKCSHEEVLDSMRSGALKAGLLVKNEPSHAKSSIEQWLKGLAGRFPSSLLFLNDSSEV
jgi:hypothetical protein